MTIADYVIVISDRRYSVSQGLRCSQIPLLQGLSVSRFSTLSKRSFLVGVDRTRNGVISESRVFISELYLAVGLSACIIAFWDCAKRIFTSSAISFLKVPLRLSNSQVF